MKKKRKQTQKTLSLKELKTLLKKSDIAQNRSFFTDDAIRIIQDSNVQNAGKVEIPQIELAVHLFLQQNGISNSLAIIVLSNLLSSYMLNTNNTLTGTAGFHNPTVH